ncbi:MAG: efflux RND transporter periplasmic adaptor subunit [Bryobacteraceae bacterium]|nr:efflux RND transporter periplasmic adaptor subunit [Bryobacteraceae bacterium]
MKRLLWLLPLAAIAWLGYRIQEQRSAPPEVRTVKAVRERLVSTMVTNGKVEPSEWATVRAAREGTLVSLALEKGKPVRAGAVVAEIDTAAARADLAAAEARMAQIQSDLEVLRGGGRPREIAELNSSIETSKLQLAEARREAEALERLVARKAATQYELDQVKDRARRAEGEIQGLEKRRLSLVARPDLDAAQARLREAETAVAEARRSIGLGVIRAPVSGVVYQLAVRKGAWVRPGDALAEIGVLNRVRVKLFVDEPELGGVKMGLPVTITWDAVAGRQWQGQVEKLPAEITAIGSRQVGEVICNIDNADGALIPGTNVTAEIRLNVVDNAVTAPKEVLRRENGAVGVFVVEGGRLAWRPVRVGAASITKVQVLEGLREGEAAVLPSDAPLGAGMVVRTVGAE